MNPACSGRARPRVLLADIGGTNARFALLADGKLDTAARMAVGDCGDLREALNVYLGGVPEACCGRTKAQQVEGPLFGNIYLLRTSRRSIDVCQIRDGDPV
jgi:glucokinase